MITIRLIDNGCERYIIESECYCLGRMWEHLAEKIQIVKPKSEENNVCTMIVSANGVVIDHLDIKDEPKDITNVFTRNEIVEISFTFTNETGYVKNSEIKEFYFAEGRKPEDFVPVEPEQTGKIDIVLGNGFVKADLNGNIVRFYNANGDKVQDLDLSAILHEKEVPTRLSELENDTEFINNTVDNLVNYYKKSETYTQHEIDNKLSLIPKFAISVVASLPTINISSTTLYLLKVNSVTGNLYEEYIRVNGAWELLGTARIDLTNYLQKTDIEDSDSVVHSFTGNKLQFNLSATIKNKIENSLVTPMSRPTATELVGIDSTNSQTMIGIGSGLKLEDGVLSSTATGSGESGGGVDEILSLDSDQMDNYMDNGGLSQGQLAVCNKVITNGYAEGAMYRFDIPYPDTYSWTQVAYSKGEIDTTIGNIETLLREV